jgi:hypothetical protein
MIRVVIPTHLRTLARVDGEVLLELTDPVTPDRVLDALELQFPSLRGTIREHHTKKRRPWLRYFACEEDLSHLPTDLPLPEAVVEGREPFFVVGAIAGG